MHVAQGRLVIRLRDWLPFTPLPRRGVIPFESRHDGQRLIDRDRHHLHLGSPAEDSLHLRDDDVDIPPCQRRHGFSKPLAAFDDSPVLDGLDNQIPLQGLQGQGAEFHNGNGSVEGAQPPDGQHAMIELGWSMVFLGPLPRSDADEGLTGLLVMPIRRGGVQFGRPIVRSFRSVWG